MSEMGVWGLASALQSFQKSFLATFLRQVAASGFEYFVLSKRSGRYKIILPKKVAKAKVLVKLFQKLADSKGRAFGRSTERNGGVGAEPPPFNRSKKFFVKLFPKKVCANEVRKTETIKFP